MGPGSCPQEVTKEGAFISWEAEVSPGQGWAVFIVSHWQGIPSAMQGTFQGFTWHFMENDLSWGDTAAYAALTSCSEEPRASASACTHEVRVGREQVGALQAGFLKVFSPQLEADVHTPRLLPENQAVKHATFAHEQRLRAFVLCKTSLAWHLGC